MSESPCYVRTQIQKCKPPQRIRNLSHLPYRWRTKRGGNYLSRKYFVGVYNTLIKAPAPRLPGFAIFGRQLVQPLNIFKLATNYASLLMNLKTISFASSWPSSPYQKLSYMSLMALNKVITTLQLIFRRFVSILGGHTRKYGIYAVTVRRRMKKREV